MSSRPHKIEAVLFDMGGVIVDGPFDSFKKYERENGLPEDFIRQLNTANPDENAWARLERGELTFDDFCEAFEKEAALAGGRLDTRKLFDGLTGAMRPEMVEAVRRCSAHFKTALLTNNFSSMEGPWAAERSDAAELLRLFDLVLESSVTGIRKPDPRFYMLACEKLDIEPQNAVFLDDLGVNLKPARALGMTTIKVVRTDDAIKALEDVVGIALS